MGKMDNEWFTKFQDVRERGERNDVQFLGDICIVILENQKRERIGATVIDSEDYEKVKRHRWYLSQLGYAITGTKITPLASVVMGFLTDKFTVIDHINRNKLDNRKVNLRVCTRAENLHNSEIRKDNTSGHKNISWDKQRGKWLVHIKINGKVRHFGRFNSIEEAITARGNAEILGRD
jgi:hypothetical protein